MKRKSQLFISFFFMIAVVITLTAFNYKKIPTASSFVNEDCTNWQQPELFTYIYFRWCNDKDNSNFKTTQLRNGYSFTVHVLYTITFTDGTKQDGGTYIDPSKEDVKASTQGRIPSSWKINKKEMQISSGSWVVF